MTRGPAGTAGDGKAPVMTPERLRLLRDTYRDELLLSTVPFWTRHAPDPEQGGYFTCLDQDGTVMQTDKSVWFQGRMPWMYATLYNTVEARPEWLDLAKVGVDFLDAHCFDADGRMFFSVTREGRPLRKRRYLFSESFAAIAYAAYGVASHQPEYVDRGFEVFRLLLDYYRNGKTEPKTSPATRPMKGLAMPMILIVTAQEMRKARNEAWLTDLIDENIEEIRLDFLKPEFRCVLEAVGPKGEFYDTLDGRLVTPGHSIEAGWFILEEARLRGDRPDYVELGTTIVDWSFKLGWDPVHGGILYFRDCKGFPPTEYWHDMKFWWPHNEAIIANLLAWELTGEAKYEQRYAMVHDWSYARFPDPLHGDWFGYLHRDGTLSTPVKGTMWKGFFHLPRMQWYCWQLLDRVMARQAKGKA
jgi:N-acylglucosamine 2-epimerase